MPQFFINRPVFAWVIALFIVLIGVISIPQLPISRYPSVAPVSVSIYAAYPGATPQTLNDSVISLVERELSGVKNLLYFESSVDSSGSAQITATFKPGTDAELAQVDVQNRIKTVEPRLPQVVRQSGLQVESAASSFLMMIGMTSPNGQFDEVALNDYLARNVVEELRRINGVGRVQLFGAEQAMRVWVDPNKLTAYGLTMNDLALAIEQQNAQIAPGRLGDEPALSGQRLTVPLTVQGQLTTPEEFAAIVLRSSVDGAKLVLADVARVELGAQSYGFSNRENGVTATSAAIQLSPGANAVRTASAVRESLAELATSMPSGMSYSVPFDTAPFVKVSIEKVIYTLFEAMVLVFLVMFLFLQKLRYTLIPAIVAPIALLGTFAVMLLAGFSINSLTMFGMVLAIGIIVDDAIVVVENVERLMATQGLSPKEATSRAMKEITGAVIGITLVLTAVFIPMAFGSGSVGVIYQQFSLSMAVSILISAFLALSLTPALCSTLLRPVSADHQHKSGFFGAFNRAFERLTDRYSARLVYLVGRSGRMMAAFAVICAVLVLAVKELPSSFLPDEDQGYFMTSIQLPTGATSERTLEVVKKYEAHVATRPALDANMVVQGFSFAGSGPNAAMAFTMLKDWDKRNGATAAEEAELAQQAMADNVEGTVMSLMPPAIDELGTSSGFTLYLQDRANRGETALLAAQAQLLELAAQSKVVSNVYPDGLPPGESINLDINRLKAEAMGLSFAAVSSTLSAAMGSMYVNDFPNNGRMQQVILQAEASARMQLDDVLSLRVRNSSGGMVPLREVVTPKWSESPQQMMRFQGFPAVRISGGAAPGISSGASMAEMERLVAQLPPGYAIAWTGASLQERQSAAQAPLLMLLSALVVFLVLAALYESWSIPLSVMLVVPLGLIGAVAAVMLRGMPNDVFFKVGMITIIGLSAKNAILIVEFARQLHAEGHSLVDAAVTAAQLRLRPILMTSLAFTLGVVPLMLASGASAETQHAIGTGVFGGMLSGTILAIFFVPIFFVFVIGGQERFYIWLSRRKTTKTAKG
ncbi:multidrug efflux RND transporter permease subunit [Shewanella decolorationis]|uniref:Efflux pump membrane transporter n=1 Tax=Shewanella decolorationis S12 TaxID=1353536 RepID=A0ABP2Z6H3_9GAMM|nr:multidrug efflux RND transporter permease subunit [Shewanella decolorationis]ESE42486.1 hydrophobe/amphiphile efflux-1 (HAE1) family protein [Shewanella decolorationis S12]GLR33958.1 multidrug efflux RND transporter permease subunit [Shewanella decolorationis]